MKTRLSMLAMVAVMGSVGAFTMAEPAEAATASKTYPMQVTTGGVVMTVSHNAFQPLQILLSGIQPASTTATVSFADSGITQSLSIVVSSGSGVWNYAPPYAGFQPNVRLLNTIVLGTGTLSLIPPVTLKALTFYKTDPASATAAVSVVSADGLTNTWSSIIASGFGSSNNIGLDVLTNSTLTYSAAGTNGGTLQVVTTPQGFSSTNGPAINLTRGATITIAAGTNSTGNTAIIGPESNP